MSLANSFNLGGQNNHNSYVNYELPEDPVFQYKVSPARGQVEKIRYEIPLCSICLNELTSNLTITSCGHVFHKECINNCLDKRSVCPNCRTYAPKENLRKLQQFEINSIFFMLIKIRKCCQR